MKPSYEELLVRIAEQDKQLTEQANQLTEQANQLTEQANQLTEKNKQLTEQAKIIKQLLERVADLESRLKKNSKNSSKPPSSDQKPNLSTPEKKESKPFHQGTLRQHLPESEVTSRTERRIEKCPECDSPMNPTGKVFKWQQIELPEIKPLVHQFELHECQCSKCQLVVMPQLEKAESHLLGSRFEAFVNLCLGRFRMGHRMVREFVNTLFPTVKLSQGLISKIKKRGADALDSPCQKIIEKILTMDAPIHVDATGWRHKGVNQHAIVLKANNLVYFTFVQSQNKETFKKLLAGKKLRLVTDRGLPVGDIDKRVHQYCLSHLLRNIQGLAEHSQTALEETGQLGEIYDDVQQLFIDKHRMEKGEIAVSTWLQYGYKVWRRIEECIDEVLSGDPSKKVGRFLRKMEKDTKYFKAYLRNPEDPMTNNPAEEALRSLVIARKLCFGSQSEYGKKWRGAIQSCIETLSRNGLSLLDFLADAVRACRYGSPCPEICPV